MSDKRFEITITEKTVETKWKGKDWEEGADASNESGWGYTPEIEKKVDVERTIYKQNTDQLDLVAVIKAINGIS